VVDGLAYIRIGAASLLTLLDLCSHIPPWPDAGPTEPHEADSVRERIAGVLRALADNRCDCPRGDREVFALLVARQTLAIWDQAPREENHTAHEAAMFENATRALTARFARLEHIARSSYAARTETGHV
jgi:hypothetical protein